ncbi:protein of unknown function DUF214 [Fibrella aestuarina BUZ 2]|uniref:Macrolide export ATP-binding/permease protein macB n=1 Tax=Fibrella aestuarina BUZ 2 TaxID=1166018 RepID=I0K276_9BACT|nr:ABC transporter permease [Fibrella aestuarina]CCG98229.1 protein of unknown function DUF214 [Fibrella aestuarina BUZ 2]
MLANYIKIAWRSLRKNKAFTFINSIGLAMGLATCMLIMLFVLDELSYDRFNEKADRIVRVIFRGSSAGGAMNEAHVMPPVAQALKADYPEVEDATRIRMAGSPIVTVNNTTFREAAVAFADSNLLQVFTLPLLEGNAKTALLRPNTAVITQALARKYFGDKDPLGQLISLKSWNATYQVTGVIDNVPTNSHFHFDLFLSMASLPEAKANSWMTSEFFTYLVLPKGYDYKRLEAKLPQVVEKYIGPQLKQAMGMSLSQFRQKGNDIGLYLQPLTDIHLHSSFAFDLGTNGNRQYVYLFGVVALLMLGIACINFMNLSTAGASKRAKEVGVRKVLGSARQSLTAQFLVESLLLTAFSLLLAVGLVYVTLPFFNELADKALTLNFIATPWLAPALLLLGLVVGVLAGSYPAFFLSAFKPIAVLKGGSAGGTRSVGGRNRISLRSGLVVVQFAVSILLTIGTAVVYQQLNYIQTKKLGYSKEQVLVLPETWLLGKNEAVFRDKIRQDSRVVNVSTSRFLPAGPSSNNNFFVYPEANSTQLVKTLRYDVDEAYIPTLGMKLAAGRNFSSAFGTDSSGVILNETAARILGWSTNALGHTIGHADNQGHVSTFRVIGVVNDFHFKSLHEPIAPLVMTLGNTGGVAIVKVKAQDISGLLASLKSQWNQLTAEAPFTYSFLDERFANTYKAEQKIGLILGLFAGLTIFVACLGLFGLATFTAEQRTKEIGVRKVLGATVPGIVALLSKDFLKLVLIALLIAVPLGWYAMTQWLAGFAYKVEIAWWTFAGAGTLAIVIALLTVSYQSISAALMNPVNSLRAE